MTHVAAAAPRYMAGPMEQWKQFSTEEKVSRLRQAIEMARTQADRWEKAVKMVSERSRKVKGADERKLMRHHRDLVKLKHKAAVKQIEVLEFMLKMMQKNPDANIFPGQDPAS